MSQSVVIHQIVMSLGYTDDAVAQAVARKLRCQPADILTSRVVRRSLDARPRNPEPRYVLSVQATVADGLRLPRLPPNEMARVEQAAVVPAVETSGGGAVVGDRPLVVGAGPAGLMAALVLAKAGRRPHLIERGRAVVPRAGDVARFWNRGELTPESNVLFGEGGAGLFSDGKLTSRSKDRRRTRELLETLVACGAPASILIDAMPHVGSDRLLRVVPQLREQILALGGTIEFEARLDDLVVEGGRLRAAVVNGREIACGACVLAVGHSARDVYTMLARREVALEAKPVAVGVRLELPQARIDQAQYGRFAGHPELGAASFRLTRRATSSARACHSFCMCPGGQVVACASEAGLLTTNGMSGSRRALPTGNAGMLVPVEPTDFPEVEMAALAGLEFQRQLERAAFVAGGGDYGLGAMRLTDFLAGNETVTLPAGLSCARSVPASLDAMLPEFVSATLREALPVMLRQLNGVDPSEIVLYGAETRTSSPVRILRDETGAVLGIPNLFPAGEGAGYAGGIVSSGIDGIKAAEAIIAL